MWIPLFLLLQLSYIAEGGKIEVAGGLFTAAGVAMVEGPTKSMLQGTAAGFGELSAVKNGKETNKNIRSVMKYLEKMRLDVSASYTEQELARSRKSFAELISKAKTLMQLFEDTVENPEDALMQSRFKEQAKESKPYSMILAVKDIISSDYSNILEAEMGNDIFHQLKTLRKTRDDVMKLLNMLCVIEVYTISLQYPDTNSPPFKTNVNKVGELVDYIWKTMDDFIENFDSKEYFNKIERIIAAVMEENGRKNNSAKADALMERLQDIFTKDRFLVAVLDDEEKCDARKIYDAQPENIAVSFIHNTIVYRSTNMSSYKKADFDKIASDLPIAVDPLSGLCSTNFAKDVRGNVTGAGLIVHDHKCNMEVRSDPRSKAHEETSFKCISKSIPNAIDNVKNMTKEKELANPFKRPMTMFRSEFARPLAQATSTLLFRILYSKMLDVDVKRIGELRMAACTLSFSDQIGLVVQKGFGAAHAMIRNEAIDVLQLTMKSLNYERNNVVGWDLNRGDPMREQIYALCEAVELILKYKILSSTAELPSSDEACVIEHYTSDAHGTVFGMDETGKADSALPTDSDREPKPALEFSSQASYAQQMIAIPANNNAHGVGSAEDNETGLLKIEEVDLEDLSAQLNDQVKQELETLMMDDGDVPSQEEKTMEQVDENTQECIDDADANEDSLTCERVPESSIPKPTAKEKRTKPKKRKTAISRKNNLRRNKQTKRNSDRFLTIGTYKCNECNVSYGWKSHLTTHKRKHAATEEARRPFQCDVCEIRFDRRPNLKRHLNSHSNEITVRKPFACDTCEARFTQRHHLKKHINLNSH